MIFLYSVVHSILLISVAFADILTEDPVFRVLTRSNVRRFQQEPLSQSNLSPWAEAAIAKLWAEREQFVATKYQSVNYEGAPALDIIFKDESSTPAGSHYYRTMWNMVMWAITKGHIRQETHVFDSSIGGNSGIALAHYAKLIGFKTSVYVSTEVLKTKLRMMTSRGTRVVRAHESLLFRLPKDDAERDPHGFFLNSVGRAAEAEQQYPNPTGNEIPSLNIYDETKQQLKTDEDISTIDYFINVIDSGALISSVAQSIDKNKERTKLVAVDPQFSIYYDWAVNDNFKTESGFHTWRGPGLPEMASGQQAAADLGNTTSFDSSQVDIIVKQPDLASIAAMWILRDKGVFGGPTSGANFLAALQVAALESSVGDFMTIVAVNGEQGELYEDTYYDRNWISRMFVRHGGTEAFDCWKSAIEECLLTGWNPINVGLDKGCRVDWR